MDYIIIALWGLVAGGLLWGGSGSNAGSEKKQISQVKEVQYVESPLDVEIEEIEEAYPVRQRASGGALSFANGGYVEKDPSIDQSAKALSFSNTGVKKNKPKKNKKGVQTTIPVRRDTVYAIASSNGSVTYTKDKSVVEAIEMPDASVQSSPRPKPVRTKPATAETPQSPISSTTQASAPTNNTQPAAPKSNVKLPGGLKVNQLLCDENGSPVIHRLRQGESLTQVAQHYYDDACFWPYIYVVNKHKLSSPDKLQAGMKLYLPDPQYYDINAKKSSSIAKAKNQIAKYTK